MVCLFASINLSTLCIEADERCAVCIKLSRLTQIMCEYTKIGEEVDIRGEKCK